MNESPVISLDSVQTRFGDKVVHRDVSLSIRKGTLNGIIGESGCGKSVLLREIVGLLEPNSGTIELLDTDVWSCSRAKLDELRARYSMLFQDSALFSALSVAENVATPITERFRLSKNTIRSLVDLRLQMSGLSIEHRDKLPSELSGGMRKRAALARALALEPEILFLDEPTSGLDPITARAFDRLIRTLVDSLEITVILVTHDVDTIVGIVDNLIVLGEGTVLAEGPVEKVRSLDRPWIKKYFSARYTASSG